MTPAEYRAELKRIGVPLSRAGDLFGFSPRSAARYARVGPPGPLIMALRLMRQHGLTAADVEPVGRPWSAMTDKEAAELRARLDRLLRDASPERRGILADIIARRFAVEHGLLRPPHNWRG